MASDDAKPARLTVEVVYSPAAREVWRWQGEVDGDATLGDALRASGVADVHPGIDWATAAVGIWGRQRPVQAPLRDGDRVEVYRPLKVDPKEARRLRYRKQRDARGSADSSPKQERSGRSRREPPR
jgi:putative ubiquitin-RnfH superfamily antitoxin RatB of RatAB toxin-antitoxin module